MSDSGLPSSQSTAAGAQTNGATAGQAPDYTQGASIEKVADFAHQVTGVTAAEDGRLFVNFPRWTEDSPISVAELLADGSLKPYPTDEWNAWRNARKDEMTPNDHWVCVQSVVADCRGSLWVLDPAAPAQSVIVPGGPKMVRIDLATNTVAQTIAFGEEVALQGSYLNDVRFSKDGRFAFITDSGLKGAIVVVEFAADGIAISEDGQYLYWQAIKGVSLYRIPTRVLIDAGLGDDEVAAAVEPFGSNGVADGLLIARGTEMMFVTAPEEDAVKVRDLAEGASGVPRTVVQDERLRWPDTFTQGPDGAIYVTTSHIQDSATFKPGAPTALPTQLWRLVAGGGEGGK
jgi:sugar lactone lactonase YvrE